MKSKNMHMYAHIKNIFSQSIIKQLHQSRKYLRHKQLKLINLQMYVRKHNLKTKSDQEMITTLDKAVLQMALWEYSNRLSIYGR